jgi:hypothetical protein
MAGTQGRTREVNAEALAMEIKLKLGDQPITLDAARVFLGTPDVDKIMAMPARSLPASPESMVIDEPFPVKKIDIGKRDRALSEHQYYAQTIGNVMNSALWRRVCMGWL